MTDAGESLKIENISIVLLIIFLLSVIFKNLLVIEFSKKNIFFYNL